MTNRFGIPDINFFDKSPDKIEQEMLFDIEEQTGITLTTSDPRRKFIQGLALFVSQERNKYDYALKQTLLAYAEDSFLDHKGEDSLTERLQATAAQTTIQYTLEDERVSALIIEAGTLFLVGEGTYFETRENRVVEVGVTQIEVEAYCTEVGIVGNGYLPGEISTQVNPLNWVKSVSNITTSAGGTEEEDDDSYAERIRLSSEKFSVAGPDGAYKYWAMTANSDIADVEVWSEEPGTVNITVLMRDGIIPTQEILDSVYEVCAENDVRPLTDLVVVEAPMLVEYSPDVTYWISEENAALVTSINNEIQQAYQEYLIWQKSKLGRDINLSELIARIQNAGAYRVQVNSEIFKSLEKNQVASDVDALCTFGGLTDE